MPARKDDYWTQIMHILCRVGLLCSFRRFSFTSLIAILFIMSRFGLPFLPHFPNLCAGPRSPHSPPANLTDLSARSPSPLPKFVDFVNMYEHVFVEYRIC